MNLKRYHFPVMLTEVVENLEVTSGGRYIDCTLGEGGHSEAILEFSQPGGQLLGLDADHEAIIVSKNRLERFKNSSFLVNSYFSKVSDIAHELNFVPVHGALLDLGLSSLQLDFEERGFSFSDNNILDMRFGLNNNLTAKRIVNEYSEIEISDIIYKFSQDPNSRVIAKAIIKSRPFNNSKELADLISSVKLKVKRKHHPATLTFQALRMAVNDEVEELNKVLSDSFSLLGVGGRLAVISYHSTEDKIVKKFINEGLITCKCPPLNLECKCNITPSLKTINKKPITPTLEEINQNPRSRSAKLRVIERIK
ncbi:MAG: 16S rRNA (cytosine(1402)-N(4))-methyltransferase RsmH [Dehalococcoidia bacterium]